MPEKPEIIAGLKNAVERGYSLEQALQSFINSGYNKQDVLDSAKNINPAIISKMPITQAEIRQPPMPELIKSLPQQSQSQPTTPPQKKKSKLIWIILILIFLAILIGTLALSLFAKEQVLAFFSKLGF